jgi:antitoxin component YwqK of YwqJK toxin-antitoxin module
MSLNAFSQVKTVYYDHEDHVIADSTQASSYAIYGKLTGDSVYTFKKYDADGYVMVTGAFKDDSLKLAHGKFVYYDWVDELSTLGSTLPIANGKERYILLTGNFKDGKRNGRWLTFYPNGGLKGVVTFVDDVLNGESKSFDTKGKLQTSGNFLDGKKNGQWISSGGRKIEQYENGKLLSTVKKSKKELEAEQKKQEK